MPNSLFSKEAQAQLKALKSELKPAPLSDNRTTDSKPDAPKNLPSKKKIDKLHAELKDTLGEDAPEQAALLFREAMAGVRPLASKNTVAPNALKSQQTKGGKVRDEHLAKRAAAAGEESQHVASGETTPLSDMQALMNPVASEAYLMYKHTSLQNRIFTQLKQGKLRWFEAVDIHGSTVEQAREAVLKVIRLTQDNGYTVCKIVHGKGKDAVLKTCVNGWLRQHPEVLAFVSATPKDGGSGAVVVLLKRGQDAGA